MAFVRMGICDIAENAFDEFSRIYGTEVIPLVQAEPGNVLSCFFRDTSKSNRVLVITGWKSEADAEIYEKSGKAQSMVARVKHLFSGPPTLETYSGYGI